MGIAPLLLALAQAGAPDLRWSLGDRDSTIPYADAQQAAYRDCLASKADALATVPTGTDYTSRSEPFNIGVADFACTAQREAFLSAMAAELRRGAPKLSAGEIADERQNARNQIAAWAEGVLFALRRMRHGPPAPTESSKP